MKNEIKEIEKQIFREIGYRPEIFSYRKIDNRIFGVGRDAKNDIPDSYTFSLTKTGKIKKGSYRKMQQELR